MGAMWTVFRKEVLENLRDRRVIVSAFFFGVLLAPVIFGLTTTMVYHAAARGLEIEAVDSELEGDLDLRGFLGIAPEVRKGYREIRVTMRVKSRASPQVLRQLAQFSPVYDVCSRALPVHVSVETY